MYVHQSLFGKHRIYDQNVGNQILKNNLLGRQFRSEMIDDALNLSSLSLAFIVFAPGSLGGFRIATAGMGVMACPRHSVADRSAEACTGGLICLDF
jgi:hypothetical protein